MTEILGIVHVADCPSNTFIYMVTMIIIIIHVSVRVLNSKDRGQLQRQHEYKTQTQGQDKYSIRKQKMLNKLWLFKFKHKFLNNSTNCRGNGMQNARGYVRSE
jgi:hypothetical protein